jgi:hypothetical protein
MDHPLDRPRPRARIGRAADGDAGQLFPLPRHAWLAACQARAEGGGSRSLQPHDRDRPSARGSGADTALSGRAGRLIGPTRRDYCASGSPFMRRRSQSAASLRKMALLSTGPSRRNGRANQSGHPSNSRQSPITAEFRSAARSARLVPRLNSIEKASAAFLSLRSASSKTGSVR